MAVKITVTSVRPTVDVEWYTRETEHETYINTHFISTGKMSKDSLEISADGLTKTLVMSWPDAADRVDYQNHADHPLIAADQQALKAHGYANNIKGTVTWETV